MSGICGIVHFDGRPVEPGLIEGMTAAMSYRGPDGLGHWVQGKVALGHCMLRTTPQPDGERQPCSSRDGKLILAMDGWLSNREDLYARLPSPKPDLHDLADAGLVLQALEAWGTGCLQHLRGDYAWIAWDVRHQRILCARDPSGNKALHYHWDGRTLSLATDPHPLHDLAWVEARPNEGLIAEYLGMAWTSREETVWTSIARLPPAHVLEATGDGLTLREFWAPDPWWIPEGTRTEAECVHRYAESFLETVRRQARSLGPLACEVSGGLDSSALFTAALHHHQSGRLPASGVLGFTLDFRGAGEADEMKYVDAVRASSGGSIECVPPSLRPLEWYLQQAGRLKSFPGFPNGIMGLGIRAEAVARGCRALLVGVGGDEWLGGSRAYYADALAGGELRRLLGIWKEDARAAGALQASAWFLRSGCLPMLPAWARHLGRRLTTRRPSSRGAGFRLAPALERMLRDRRERARERMPRPVRVPSQRQLWNLWDGAYGLLARESEERLAAQAGLELRRPYFDQDLVQFLFAVPVDLKLRGSVNKWLHRKAMAPFLPPAVADRADKADFMAVFRAQGDELRTRLAEADFRSEALAWVRGDSLESVLASLGDTRLQGLPEWSAWALWGCLGLGRCARSGG